MLVTELGIVTEVRLEQFRNMPAPMLVTEFGIVTEVSPVQTRNASVPMLVTEYVFPLYVTEEGMVRFPVGFVWS